MWTFYRWYDRQPNDLRFLIFAGFEFPLIIAAYYFMGKGRVEAALWTLLAMLAILGHRVYYHYFVRPREARLRAKSG